MAAMQDPTRFTAKRRSLVTVLLILPPLIVLGTRLILGSSLPQTTATHWSGALPDGFTSTTLFFGICLGLGLIGTVLGLAALRLKNPTALFMTLFFSSLATWSSAGLFTGCAIPTALADDPQHAELGIWFLLPILATLLSLVATWLPGAYAYMTRAQQAKREQRIAEGQARAAGLPVPESSEAHAGEPAAGTQEFEESMNGPWWLWLLGLAVPAIVLVPLLVPDALESGESTAGIIISLFTVLVIVPLVLGLARIKVTASSQGLKVRSAVFGFPLRTIAIEDIEAVASETIEPMQWGGWGWRFFPGGSAVVFKRHEGLAVELKENRRFAVTITRSAEASELLNNALAASRA